MSYLKKLFETVEPEDGEYIEYSLVLELLRREQRWFERLVSLYKATKAQRALAYSIEAVRANPRSAPEVFRTLSAALQGLIPDHFLGPLEHGVLPHYLEQKLEMEVVVADSHNYRLEYLDDLETMDREFSLPTGVNDHISFTPPGASLSPGYVFASNVSTIADNRNVVIEGIKNPGVIREISMGNVGLLQGSASKISSTTEFKGTSLLLVGLTVQPNYYHWMFDVIVRLIVAKESGKSWQRILINSMNFNSMHKDLLECAGIDVEEIEFIVPGRKYVFENLIVPLTIADFGNAQQVRRVDRSKPDRRVRPWRIPRWSTKLIRSKVFGSSRYQELEGSAPDKIFIGRRGSRSLINQEQVETLLETHNYQVVYLEDYTFLEQAALLSKVKSVIALHGAGLANLVFCSPSTRVLEIFNVDYVNPCYFHLATQLDLDYECLIVGDRDKNSVNLLDPQKSNDGISLDIDDLRNYLSRK